MNCPRRFLPVLLLSFLVNVPGAWAQGKITLQHDEQFTYYPADSLQAALDDAQDGDFILLPGGVFTGSFTLDRTVSIMGVGYYPDSTTATSASIITGSLILTSNSSNSYLSGIHIGEDITTLSGLVRVDNIIVHRCLIGDDISGFNGNSSGWVVAETIFNSYFGMKSCLIANVICDGQILGHSNSIIEQSIFLWGNTIGDDPIESCDNCVIKGSIFTNINGKISGGSGLQWARAINNVFVAPSIGSLVTGYQNIVGADQASIFVNFIGSNWTFAFDAHLAANSPAIGAGPEGTDCGIYGGPSPWKEGAVPITPHIQQQIIGTTTNPTGGLPVQIRVAAQDR